MAVPQQIVSTPAELAECVSHLAASPRLGLDTEFVGEETYHPRLCLVQVAALDRLVLIDPFTVGPLDAFWNLITDPARTVIVHAGREEVRLCRLWSGRAPGDLFDLQIAAGLVGLNYPMGHAALVNSLLRIQIAKGETLTEWRERPLTRAQVEYAFDDVRYLLALHDKVATRLGSLGRIDWAREEFGRLEQHATAPIGEAAEKFRKLRGLGSLDRRRLAIVRELYAWREEKAAQVNRPARTVVRDDLLVEIARRNPSKERDLHVVRGLAKRDLDVIIETVARARALPLEACPKPTERDADPPQVGLVCHLLQAVLADWCARNQLAPSLACSASDLKLLVRARRQGLPLPEDNPLSRGWRAAHLLPELLAVLDGQRRLRITDLRSDSPFTIDDV